MTKILTLEMAALLLALLSIAAADCLYYSGRVPRSLHSLWVSLSIAAMCLPVLDWVAAIFIGPGALAHGLAGALAAALVLGLYRNLRMLSALRKPGHRMPRPPLPVKTTPPPASG